MGKNGEDNNCSNWGRTRAEFYDPKETSTAVILRQAIRRSDFYCNGILRMQRKRSPSGQRRNPRRNRAPTAVTGASPSNHGGEQDDTTHIARRLHRRRNMDPLWDRCHMGYDIDPSKWQSGYNFLDHPSAQCVDNLLAESQPINYIFLLT